jgi:hypothetical protein
LLNVASTRGERVGDMGRLVGDPGLGVQLESEHGILSELPRHKLALIKGPPPNSSADFLHRAEDSTHTLFNPPFTHIPPPR